MREPQTAANQRKISRSSTRSVHFLDMMRPDIWSLGAADLVLGTPPHLHTLTNDLHLHLSFMLSTL